MVATAVLEAYHKPTFLCLLTAAGSLMAIAPLLLLARAHAAGSFFLSLPVGRFFARYLFRSAFSSALLWDTAVVPPLQATSPAFSYGTNEHGQQQWVIWRARSLNPGDPVGPGLLGWYGCGKHSRKGDAR